MNFLVQIPKGQPRESRSILALFSFSFHACLMAMVSQPHLSATLLRSLRPGFPQLKRLAESFLALLERLFADAANPGHVGRAFAVQDRKICRRSQLSKREIGPSRRPEQRDDCSHSFSAQFSLSRVDEESNKVTKRAAKAHKFPGAILDRIKAREIEVRNGNARWRIVNPLDAEAGWRSVGKIFKVEVLRSMRGAVVVHFGIE